MRVVKYHLGTYTYRNQRFPLCLYHFLQLKNSIGRAFTFHLKLRDLDQIFCETTAGYIYNTKVLDSCKDGKSQYVLTEGNGDIYVEAHVVEEIARQVGEKMLVELCRLDEVSIKSGEAKNILGPLRNITLDEAIEVVEDEIHVSAGLNSGQTEVHVKTEELIDSSGFHIPRLSRSPQLDKTVRRVRSLNGMAIEEVLDRRSIIFDRLSTGGIPPRKMGPISEDYARQLVNHRFPHDSDHSSSHSPPSHAATPIGMLDGDSKERKRKRPITPLSSGIAGNKPGPTVTATTEYNRGSTHVVEDVTEHIRALHRQQKQQQHNAQPQGTISDGHHYMRHLQTNVGHDIPPKSSGLTRGKNTRNLTIYTPSYEETTGAPKSAPIHSTMGNSGLRIYPSQSAQLYSGINGQGLAPPNTAIPYDPSRYTRGISSYHPPGYMGATPTVKSNAPPQDPSVNIPQPSVPPRPVTAHPYSSQATYYSNKTYPQRTSPSKSISHTAPSNNQLGSKQQFMSLFESLFDNVDSARGLKVQLEDQIRKSTTLLQTLQASGPMIEGLVRSHFRDMQGQFIEKYDASIEDIVKRLDRIEERQLYVDQQRSKGLNQDVSTENHKESSSRPELPTAEGDDSSELPSPPPILSHPRLDKEGHLTRVVKSQGVSSDMKTRDYEEMIKGLVDRLETLERRIDQH
ncbi:hypothetical protein K7432_011078 [Basidiobolus ranarum]|uniref:Uncharacterized protein n=1 Tax=Basidiobolus ranarum TaxID=34480 RepID=A0ABR2VVE8_9FUNG